MSVDIAAEDFLEQGLAVAAQEHLAVEAQAAQAPQEDLAVEDQAPQEDLAAEEQPLKDAISRPLRVSRSILALLQASSQMIMAV